MFTGLTLKKLEATPNEERGKIGIGLYGADGMLVMALYLSPEEIQELRISGAPWVSPAHCFVGYTRFNLLAVELLGEKVASSRAKPTKESAPVRKKVAIKKKVRRRIGG